MNIFQRIGAALRDRALPPAGEVARAISPAYGPLPPVVGFGNRAEWPEPSGAMAAVRLARSQGCRPDVVILCDLDTPHGVEAALRTFGIARRGAGVFDFDLDWAGMPYLRLTVLTDGEAR